MSYCVNPACPQPENVDDALKCKACGSKLLLRNRYKVIQPLGKGGFGATFLAQDMSLPGRPSCVVKQLRPTATSARILEMARELFQREAKTLGKIGDHPQVPRLIDYFVGGKQFYLVQEYIDGYTLKQEVKEKGVFNEAQAKKFLREILPLLNYIHSQEVIHRDIKPANILRRRIDQNLVLIDFGAVKDQVNQATMMGTGQTAFTNFAIGTSGFAPPEQMALRPVYASDIYAVGMTCVYLMTGKSPNSFESNSVTGEIMWLPHLDVSDFFANILQRMLEFSVQYRYQSAQDVLRALDSESSYGMLAEGMVTQQKSTSTPNPKLTNSTNESTFLNEPNTSLMLPSQRMAAQIRARNQRVAKKKQGNLGGDTDIYDDNSFVSGMSATEGSPRTMIYDTVSNNTKSSLPPTTPKWTENTLKTAYIKGRRDFADCELSGLNLENFDFSGTNFYESRLSNSNFQGADLTEANFGRARLTEVNFRNAQLVKAYLSNANLERADLRGANLRESCLNRANLRGVNLCGANLTHAIVSDEQLAMAKLNWRTIRPNGKRKLWCWWF
ncbi:serine/threonine-protein kinase [Planktothrix pseudagardhii]|uniref:Serine/threonine-protein kinase B n=1 Tax=Planktothrix pseudagardhii TaxID=132604 RepID=A0A9W4CSR4_9CYAN|nr:serine/threonine-protein kinase [Planktothrix pseudagardhii]CAD5982981.1 Serine/threonine-protein kinase B [Planktothrix pseudagardhii]